MIEYQLKVYSESLCLKKQIENEGFEAKLVRNGIIVPLRVELNGAYAIPKCTLSRDKALALEGQETGGGRSNSGFAHVVAGMTGKPLKPYLVPRGGHLACGTHGYFTTIERILSVTANYSQGLTEIRISEVNGSIVDDVAVFKDIEIWKGQLTDLPRRYGHFQAAATAAYNKAHCYHCRCLHYSLKD